ncbi:MAG: tyrosine recombinase XerC [Gammaproteobacteria bacterium]|nr:tyrosine recombinase XerC [Gammaproteobacteria bacterium]
MSANPSLHDAIIQFLQHLKGERQLSPLTIKHYQRDLQQLLAYCQQSEIVQWQRVDSHHIRSLVSQLHRRGSGARSLQRLLSACRTFFHYLIRENQISNNPALAIKAPKAPQPLPKTLNTEEITQLLGSVTDKQIALRDFAMMELMYSSGLRLAELVALNLDSLDSTSQEIIVTGKGNKERIVPVGRYAISAIKNWLNVRNDWCKIDNTSCALFISQRGRRLGARSVQARMAYWGKQQGLGARLNPHKLRHSFATHVLESSGDIRAVQEMLGHTNLSTTQIYTHLDFQHLAKVYDAAHPRARRQHKD